MTVIEFVNHAIQDHVPHLGLSTVYSKILKRKCKQIAREDVLSGGNDMWLASELGIGRDRIEAFAKQKRTNDLTTLKYK